MSRGEKRNTPEQMGREKQDWRRNAENCLLLLTHLEAGRTTGMAVRPRLKSCMLTALMQRQNRVLALMQKEFLVHELGIQNSNSLL